jgi:hypothetical protein
MARGSFLKSIPAFIFRTGCISGFIWAALFGMALLVGLLLELTVKGGYVKAITDYGNTSATIFFATGYGIGIAVELMGYLKRRKKRHLSGN